MESMKNINDLPATVLPEFWNDKERMNALYAPFRDRSVNARDWDSKLSFWKNLISTWCKYNKICSFCETELRSYLINGDRSPACLNIVVLEMYRNGDIQTFEQFMEMPQTSWSSWAVDLAVRKPLKWSIKKVKDTFLAPASDVKYIHTATVQVMAESVFNAIPNNHRNKLLTIEETMELCNNQDMTISNFKLLLHYLLREGKSDIYYGCNHNDNEHNMVLIKFAEINKKVERVNEIDLGKYKLEQNEKTLIKMLEELENEKREATNSAKVYLAKGMRQMAKNSLRKQHEIEKRIAKQVTVLENVQTLLVRVTHAESDSNVLQSYKTGVEALKIVFKENGLSEDLVADTMIEVGEVLEIHDDIQASLAQQVTTSLDNELEEELAELLAEEVTEGGPPNEGGTPDKQEQADDELERRLQTLKLPDFSPQSSKTESTMLPPL